MVFANFDATGMAAVIGSLAALVTAVSVLIGVVAKLWHRDNVTDRRIDQLWRAHMRRGISEGIGTDTIQELGHSNQEMRLALRPDVRQAYEPIAPALRALYRDAKRLALTDVQFIELLEKEFGSWLSRFICLPYRLNEFACLEMAKLVAMERAARPDSWPKDPEIVPPNAPPPVPPKLT